MSKNLIEILEENDIRLIPRGERWVATCPFHEGDHSPSFTVYPEMSYFCFGCRAWGDAIKFLMDFKGMPYERALEYAGIEGRKRRVKRVIKVVRTTYIYPYLREVAETYHQFLLKTPGAVSYLHYRGLTDETISKYRIGFTDGGIIDPRTSHDYGLARESGVLSEDKDNNYWETLSHRITIPNLLQGDLCDFIMGRTVTKVTPKYLGLRIPKPLYGLQEAMESPVVFLVEGHFDWLILKQWGYPAIVSGGTNIPEYNLMALRARKVIIVPDNDEEGIKAALSIHEKLPDSQILGYGNLGVKDVGELGTQGNGQTLFDYTVMGQGSWIPNLSQKILVKWFPRFSHTRHLLST